MTQETDTTPPRPGPGRTIHIGTPVNPLLACFVELVGTFMLVLVGTAVATAAILGKGTAGPAYNSLAVALSFGFILTPVAAALGPVSGAHVNPAVTLGLALAGRFPWRNVTGYVIAQTLGAILAALIVWAAYGHGAYYDSHLGAPSPANGAGVLQVLLVEAMIAFILVLTVLFTTTDARMPPGVAPIAIGFALTAGVFLGGPVSGGAGNPARAFGPMLVSGHFPAWFFYVIGPLLGAGAAAFIFRTIRRGDVPHAAGDEVASAADAEPDETGSTRRDPTSSQGSANGMTDLVSRLVEGRSPDVLGDARQVAALTLQAGEDLAASARRLIRDRPAVATLTAMTAGAAVHLALKLRRR